MIIAIDVNHESADSAIVHASCTRCGKILGGWRVDAEKVEEFISDIMPTLISDCTH